MKKVRLIELVVLGLGIMIGGLSLSVLGQTDPTSDSEIAAFPRRGELRRYPGSQAFVTSSGYGDLSHGIILVSPALSCASLIGVPGNDLPYILNVSAMTAAAWYHEKIDPSYQESKLEDVLEEVRFWSEHEYAWALWQGNALRRVDFLHIFVAIGLFDMACVHDATIYEIRRMDLPRETLDNITITTYPAGHMMYTDPFIFP